MNNTKIRETVLRLFETHRQTPGAYFDDARFMAFLTKKTHKSEKVAADTFVGRYRHTRFMEAVQIEFGVCFNSQDWDRGFSMEALTDLIQEKVAKPEVALRLAKNQLADAKTDAISSPVKFGALLCSFLIPLGIIIKYPVWRFILLFFGIMVLGLVVCLSQRQVAYAKRLIERIKKSSIQDL